MMGVPNLGWIAHRKKEFCQIPKQAINLHNSCPYPASISEQFLGDVPKFDLFGDNGQLPGVAVKCIYNNVPSSNPTSADGAG